MDVTGEQNIFLHLVLPKALYYHITNIVYRFECLHKFLQILTTLISIFAHEHCYIEQTNITNLRLRKQEECIHEQSVII
jgi:hypothetical protein